MPPEKASFRYYTCHNIVSRISNSVLMQPLQNLITIFGLSQKQITTNTASEVTMLLDAPFTLISYWDLFHRVAMLQNYTDKFLCSKLTWLDFPQMQRSHCWTARKGFLYKEVFNIKLVLKNTTNRYKNFWITKY